METPRSRCRYSISSCGESCPATSGESELWNFELSSRSSKPTKTSPPVNPSGPRSTASPPPRPSLMRRIQQAEERRLAAVENLKDAVRFFVK
jgi:hypothetical protein